MKFYLKTFSFLVLLCPLPALADDHVDGDEPEEIVNELFLSDTVYSQDKGEWQITISPQYEKNDGDERFLVPVEIEYGITDQFQIEIEYTPYINIEFDNGASESGNGNFEIGFQYGWSNVYDSGIHVAVAYSHEFAEGDSAVISDPGEEPEDQDNLYIEIAKDIDEDGDSQVFIQIGNEFEGSENEAYINVGMYAQSSSYVLSGELNWTEDQSFITPGISWKQAEGWEFGVGVPIGIDGEEDFKLIFTIITEWE